MNYEAVPVVRGVITADYSDGRWPIYYVLSTDRLPSIDNSSFSKLSWIFIAICSVGFRPSKCQAGLPIALHSNIINQPKDQSTKTTNLQYIVDRLAVRAGEERRQCIAADVQGAAALVVRTAKLEIFAANVVERWPILRARGALTLEPVALLQDPPPLVAPLLREYRAVVFGDHFARSDCLDGPHDDRISDEIPTNEKGKQKQKPKPKT